MSKKLFQFSAGLVFSVFMGMMIYVIFAAYSRKSGSTGHDMGSIQKMRYVAEKSSG